MEDQSPRRHRRIGGFGQRAEASLSGACRLDNVDQMLERACPPIEFRDDDQVVRAALVEHMDAWRTCNPGTRRMSTGTSVTNDPAIGGVFSCSRVKRRPARTLMRSGGGGGASPRPRAAKVEDGGLVRILLFEAIEVVGENRNRSIFSTIVFAGSDRFIVRPKPVSCGGFARRSVIACGVRRPINARVGARDKLAVRADGGADSEIGLPHRWSYWIAVGSDQYGRPQRAVRQVLPTRHDKCPIGQGITQWRSRKRRLGIVVGITGQPGFPVAT